MKISARQYAAGLFATVAGKSNQEAKDLIKNLVVILDKNNDLNKEGAIIAAFNELWNDANGEVAASLSSARELDQAAQDDIVAYLKEKTGAKKILLEENIDKSLIGGFVLRYGSKVLDGSLKNSLRSLRHKISN